VEKKESKKGGLSGTKSILPIEKRNRAWGGLGMRTKTQQKEGVKRDRATIRGGGGVEWSFRRFSRRRGDG